MHISWSLLHMNKKQYQRIFIAFPHRVGWSQSETSTKLYKEGGKTPGIIYDMIMGSFTEGSLNMNEMSIKQFTTVTQTQEVTCTCSNIYQTWQWLHSRSITKTALGEKPFNTFIARHLYISFNLQAKLPHLQTQKIIGKNFILCWYSSRLVLQSVKVP